MSYTFDGVNKVCILDAGTTSLSISDMYSRWKEWVAQDDNAKFLPMLSVIGGDTTIGNNAIASYFFITNGWKIRPQEANHTLTVQGIINADDGSDPFTDPVGNWRVRIVQIVPMQAETITVYESGAAPAPTGPTASDVANAVWSHKWALTVAKFLGLS